MKGTFISKSLFWVFITALFLGFLWLFKAVLMPFILGFAVAYLLNPVIFKLEKIKLTRKPASL